MAGIEEMLANLLDVLLFPRFPLFFSSFSSLFGGSSPPFSHFPSFSPLFPPLFPLFLVVLLLPFSFFQVNLLHHSEAGGAPVSGTFFSFFLWATFAVFPRQSMRDVTIQGARASLRGLVLSIILILHPGGFQWVCLRCL